MEEETKKKISQTVDKCVSRMAFLTDCCEAMYHDQAVGDDKFKVQFKEVSWEGMTLICKDIFDDLADVAIGRKAISPPTPSIYLQGGF